MTANAAIQIEARTKSVGDSVDFIEAGESIREVLALVGGEALDGASGAGVPPRTPGSLCAAQPRQTAKVMSRHTSAGVRRNMEAPIAFFSWPCG